jgi:hypothetical protein
VKGLGGTTFTCVLYVFLKIVQNVTYVRFRRDVALQKSGYISEIFKKEKKKKKKTRKV